MLEAERPGKEPNMYFRRASLVRSSETLCSVNDLLLHISMFELIPSDGSLYKGKHCSD